MGYNERMPLEDEFGDIIAKARAGKAWSTRQLAEAAGLSEREISEIESCRMTPQDAAIKRLADCLGLDARKLSDIAHGSWLPQPASKIPRSIIVERVYAPFGPYGENVYVVGCRASLQGAVVDPGGAVGEIEQRLLADGLELSVILVTHAHADHIGGLRQLAATHPGVTVVSSPQDRQTIMQNIDTAWQAAEDGSKLMVGRLNVTALATPGHTVGSVCYVIDGVCFVGDTLFAGSIGRPTHHYATMLAAIQSKILSLPDETVLLPGHGPATTVEEERMHNPFF